MRKSMLALLVAVATLPVLGAGFGLKPGLWETHIVKQVIDGRDMSSEMAGVTSQMQQAMANVPPEQRARIEAMMKQRGAPAPGGDSSTMRMCISPEMANRDNPMVDREGRCQPQTVKRSGAHTSFEFNCSSNGVTTTGKGESTATGDLITSRVDATTRKANGETHVTHSETEMKFLGSDCGDVKPVKIPKAAP